MQDMEDIYSFRYKMQIILNVYVLVTGLLIDQKRQVIWIDASQKMILALYIGYEMNLSTYTGDIHS
jgi:hypothetical protein